jgi:hypothetical protein
MLRHIPTTMLAIARSRRYNSRKWSKLAGGAGFGDVALDKAFGNSERLLAGVARQTISH